MSAHKRWSKERVQSYMDEHMRGFRIVSEHKNSATKITIECPQSHLQTCEWKGFMRNKTKCKDCKKEIEKDRFKDLLRTKGYEVLSESTEDVFNIMCESGHAHDYNLLDFMRGKTCKTCNREKLGEERRHSYEYVKNFFEVENNYELISKEYKSNETALEVVCPKGHEYETSFQNFRAGYRCRECNGSKKFTLTQAREKYKGFSYSLIGDEYLGVDRPLPVLCPRGHKAKISLTSLAYGGRCMKCSIASRSGENHYRWDGGVSNVNEYFREKINDWKRKSLASTNFTCSITGVKGKGDLEVHHLRPFSQIVKDAHEANGIEIKSEISKYSREEIDSLAKNIGKEHEKLLGIPLHKEVHLLFHKTFGFTNNTPEQFYLFEKDFKIYA